MSISSAGVEAVSFVASVDVLFPAVVTSVMVSPVTVAAAVVLFPPAVVASVSFCPGLVVGSLLVSFVVVFSETRKCKSVENISRVSAPCSSRSKQCACLRDICKISLADLLSYQGGKYLFATAKSCRFSDGTVSLSPKLLVQIAKKSTSHGRRWTLVVMDIYL